MIESTIRDFKTEVETLFHTIQPIASGFSDLQEDIDNIQKGIEKSNPSLMFYGIYNAGKSSLLNAIFGEMKASVNDIPETHQVTWYNWRSFILVDTPGLNGPEEDEVITMKEVKKHDVIMFVIDDSDNFDSDVITEKIIEILQTKRPCIIVINKKNDSNDDKIMGIKAKIHDNIQKLSNVTQNYDFIAVDAKSALKAKIENKTALLEDSNLMELEYLIGQKLRTIDDITMLKIPLQLIVKLCSCIIVKFDDEFNELDSKKIIELQGRMEDVHKNIKQSFSIELRAKIDSYAEQIYTRASSGESFDIDKEKCEKEIQIIISDHFRRFAEISKVTLSDFSNNWKMNVEAAYQNIDHQKVCSIRRDVTRDEDAIDELLDVLEKVPIFVPTPPDIPIPLPIIVQIIKGLKKWIFGSGKDEMPDVDDANDKQRQYAREKEVALRQLHNSIYMQLDAFYQKVKDTFDSELDEIYNKQFAELQSAIERKESQKKDILEQRKVIISVKEQAESLVVAIAQ